jgi:hypothetical protein
MQICICRGFSLIWTRNAPFPPFFPPPPLKLLSLIHTHILLYSQDIGPRYAGMLLGLSNTAGVLAGVISTYLVGYLLSEGGSWSNVWGAAVATYCLGAVLWNLLATGRKIFD